MLTSSARAHQRIQRSKRIQRAAEDSDNDNSEIEWEGEPVEKLDKVDDEDDTKKSKRVTRGSNLSNKVKYAAFRRGGTVYRVGDCVILEANRDDDQLGIITQLFEDEAEEKQAGIRWLYTNADIEQSSKAVKMNVPEKSKLSSSKAEVYFTSYTCCLGLEAIKGRCEVLSQSEFDQRYPRGDSDVPKSKRGKVFFCSTAYDVKKNAKYALDWTTFYDDGKGPFNSTAANELFPSLAPATKSRSTPKRVCYVESDEERPKRARRSQRSKDDFDASYSSSDGEENDQPRTPSCRRQTNYFSVRTPTGNRLAAGGPIRTPTKTPKRRSPRSLQNTPKSTPLPTRAVSRGKPGTDFERARERLHVSAIPDTLPCRENEFSEVFSHLQSALEEETGCCLYISGVPGTGKTATVHEVIRTLQSEAENGEIAPFQFVGINGMKLTEPSQAYVQLWEALSGKRVTASHAADLLEKEFSSPSPRSHTCIVLMDELDLLVTKKQKIMYNFFDWPNRPHARLVVVAVANTMDLPERVLTNKVSSRLGLTRIPFLPYSHDQLRRIVASRLEGINLFHTDAIELCARKVSSVSGDARRALDICRRAVEMIETASKNQTDGVAQVTMNSITDVCKEMFTSGNLSFITKASLHQKMFLWSVTQAVRKSGIGEVDFSKVAQHHFETCRLYNLVPPSTSDLASICANLGATRCLIVEAGRLDLYQRIRLNVCEEDVDMALRDDVFFKRLFK